MAVLAIAGVLAATAAPAMQNIVYEQRLTAYVNELFGDLQLARSEAIKRVVQVTLCKSSDGAACSTTSNWQSGWIVFVDTDGDETADSGETIIKVRQALESGVTLRYGSSYDYVYYKSDGTAWPNATFTFCDTRGASYARAIIVSNTGRARTSSEASDGGALSCS
ncbi:MAG: pilus assembly protein [Gammaproteobacteria bacterium]|nr:MAG: pilus assembly protein [Gammaproteobacteria bacterium]